MRLSQQCSDSYSIRVRLTLTDFLLPNTDWQRFIGEKLDEAERRGFVLLLMSARQLQSAWCRWELQHAIEGTRRYGRSYGVIPVIISDRESVVSEIGGHESRTCSRST